MKEYARPIPAIMYSRQTVEGAKIYDLTDGDRPVSAHFRLREFQCRDGSHLILLHPALVDLLEAIRAAANREGRASVKINSAYRTIAYNQQIGGARYSQHCKGLAADIKIRIDGQKMQPSQVADLAEQFNPGGLGRYRTFTHVDVFGEGRRWGA